MRAWRAADSSSSSASVHTEREQNSAGARLIGVAALSAGSLALVAGPLYLAWERRSVLWLCAAGLVAGRVFIATLLAETLAPGRRLS